MTNPHKISCRCVWAELLILAILAGCNHPRAGVIPPAIAPAGKTGQPLPYEHPAAEKVRKIFETLDVTSEERYRELPKRDRYVWDVRWFETEAMNGGLDQFLWNTTGDHTQETLEALKAIGATESHAALLAACKFFPDETPDADTDKRRKQFEAIRAKNGDRNLDDMLPVDLADLEYDLYQKLLNYYEAADPQEK